ncbi:ATP-binding protein [Sphingobacterium sp. E70]|nr:ATP-binding protein [Sphingobacterium sp. E70]
MRRLVNTIIQLIDYFPAEAVLIAATNHPEILDTAIIRRFSASAGF